MVDYLIVGAGLYGAVFAQEARKRGKRVLVLEKRDHIAGNIHTEETGGIQVHRYGAHIFHTNDRAVWEYVNRFAEFNRYTNAPVANWRGEIYSLPFNMYTFNRLWNTATPEEAERELARQRAEITHAPRNLEEQAISLVGRDVYEKLIRGYTEKQWGRPCAELPAFIIRRLPVRLTYDNNYFNARFQGIPVDGYTELVRKLLGDTEVILNCDYLRGRDEWNAKAGKVIYTGPVDAYFDYAQGPLAYRSLRFETETLETANFQGNAVVNFTDRETPWTRIIEHKWFTFGLDRQGREIPHTVISREYSMEWTKGCEPYYPVNDEKNNARYEAYRAMARREEKVIFGGRLGEYRYYDMDQVIAAALRASREEIRQ